MVDHRANITRPLARAFNTSMVIKADSFPEWHKRFVNAEVGVLDVGKGLANLRSADTVMKWGATFHRAGRRSFQARRQLGHDPLVGHAESQVPDRFARGAEPSAWPTSRRDYGRPSWLRKEPRRLA